MLEVENKKNNEETKKTTSGGNIKAYLEHLKALKVKNIGEFKNLICLYFDENNYLAPKRVAVEGGSTEPVCFVRFSAPFDKKCVEALDIRGKKVALSGESVLVSTEVVRTLFKEIDDETMEEIRAALAEEDLFMKVNEKGVYIIYAECLANKAEELLK